MSQTQVTTSGKNTSAVPAQERQAERRVAEDEQEGGQRAGVERRRTSVTATAPSGLRVGARRAERPGEQRQDPERADVGPPVERPPRPTSGRLSASQVSGAASGGGAEAQHGATACDALLAREGEELAGAEHAGERVSSATSGQPPNQTMPSASGIATTANAIRVGPCCESIRPGRGRSGDRAAGSRGSPRRSRGG